MLGATVRRMRDTGAPRAERAWFFIDSADEAKSSGIRLEKALRNPSAGVYGADQRSHIFLSGRIADL